MLGSDQAQRSNAVGHHTSYIPDADPGRHGGNTYTGSSTDPTIQDYENFFGPSARDIKTDLQRFKRHGRWHLPDMLKGPNPWLTDRIDGLITDATNSPFTTKILPYRYKDEVDGKIKWNVWNFDEGMASRVPYESAARTLQQSKRSFAGYMVRQGMAIVLEHNFMMTPKGRENFKNQLNQLIGSIQYTNDLDVHMALVLAPSYQKTMRERYYTLDKSPSQICREFVDLFGMMQKNVNALDILIEEGKAILRTWGGPMPDFLLCNSKLTFQMTMTPEKTNYITQGTDGVKRLRQGPDLGSYRGLSVIHSRSFAMEVGQHPRDILRRRVRTAEYYRILPDKNNHKREFEFYNEERDTWFTLTFQDLLRIARHIHEEGADENTAAVDRAFHVLSNSTVKKEPAGLLKATARMPMTKAFPSLGVYVQSGDLSRDENVLIELGKALLESLETGRAIIGGWFLTSAFSYIGESTRMWALSTPRFDLGIRHIYPKNNRVWNTWTKLVKSSESKISNTMPISYVLNALHVEPNLTTEMMKNLYNSLKNVALNDPITPGTICHPRSPSWYAAFAFYTDIYKRSGIPMGYFKEAEFNLVPGGGLLLFNTAEAYTEITENLSLMQPMPKQNRIDITSQILNANGGVGSVNHTMFLSLSDRDISAPFDADSFAGRFFLTYEVIAPLLREWRDKTSGKIQTGMEWVKYRAQSPTQELMELIGVTIERGFLNRNLLDNTVTIAPIMLTYIRNALKTHELVDPETHDAVFMARNGIHTWPLGVTTLSYPFHPYVYKRAETAIKEQIEECKRKMQDSYGHLSLEICKYLQGKTVKSRGYPFKWAADDILSEFNGPQNADGEYIANFWRDIENRLFQDPVITHPSGPDLSEGVYLQNMPNAHEELEYMETHQEDDSNITSSIAPGGLSTISIDVSQAFTVPEYPPTPERSTKVQADLDRLEDIEVVIIRPNIEHNMLGVIMGQGGETLGNTLWGQTELSVYDDSMHGIWGMSYKYHERAIVFNEKNLIRLWDIAYDGYNGGKDDTYVDWLNPDTPNGYQTFKELTLDVSKNYRGPSMMVMAFVHDKEKRDDAGIALFDKHFRRNWPSPIVFHDSRAGSSHHGADKETLPVDYDNLQVIDVDEFRVFNNSLYAGPYGQYRALMPHFHEMHLMRKTAGQSSADAETHTDSLAFQGSMKIKENGIVVQEVHGSGHHGPDYTGIASVRAGKGQKTAGQAPTLHRLI